MMFQQLPLSGELFFVTEPTAVIHFLAFMSKSVVHIYAGIHCNQTLYVVSYLQESTEKHKKGSLMYAQGVDRGQQ